VTISFGNDWKSRVCGVRIGEALRAGEAAGPRGRAPLAGRRAVGDSIHTSRGEAESSRRKASVSPFASIEGRLSSAGPLVSAVNCPSSVVL
jgi:hypothetical protein